MILLLTNLPSNDAAFASWYIIYYLLDAMKISNHQFREMGIENILNEMSRLVEVGMPMPNGSPAPILCFFLIVQKFQAQNFFVARNGPKWEENDEIDSNHFCEDWYVLYALDMGLIEVTPKKKFFISTLNSKIILFEAIVVVHWRYPLSISKNLVLSIVPTIFLLNSS